MKIVSALYGSGDVFSQIDGFDWRLGHVAVFPYFLGLLVKEYYQGIFVRVITNDALIICVSTRFGQ